MFFKIAKNFFKSQKNFFKSQKTACQKADRFLTSISILTILILTILTTIPILSTSIYRIPVQS